MAAYARSRTLRASSSAIGSTSLHFMLLYLPMCTQVPVCARVCPCAHVCCGAHAFRLIYTHIFHPPNIHPYPPTAPPLRDALALSAFVELAILRPTGGNTAGQGGTEWCEESGDFRLPSIPCSNSQLRPPPLPYPTADASASEGVEERGQQWTRDDDQTAADDWEVLDAPLPPPPSAQVIVMFLYLQHRAMYPPNFKLLEFAITFQYFPYLVQPQETWLWERQVLKSVARLSTSVSDRLTSSVSSTVNHLGHNVNQSATHLTESAVQMAKSIASATNQ
jgi:hypothetical protein